MLSLFHVFPSFQYKFVFTLSLRFLTSCHHIACLLACLPGCLSDFPTLLTSLLAPSPLNTTVLGCFLHACLCRHFVIVCLVASLFLFQTFSYLIMNQSRSITIWPWYYQPVDGGGEERGKGGGGGGDHAVTDRDTLSIVIHFYRSHLVTQNPMLLLHLLSNCLYKSYFGWMPANQLPNQSARQPSEWHRQL